MVRYQITGIIYMHIGMNEWVKRYTWEFPERKRRLKHEGCKLKAPKAPWPWWVSNSNGAHSQPWGWESLWWQNSRSPVCRYSWWPYGPSVQDGDPRATTPTKHDTIDTRLVHKYTRWTRQCHPFDDIVWSLRDAAGGGIWCRVQSDTVINLASARDSC